MEKETKLYNPYTPPGISDIERFFFDRPELVEHHQGTIFFHRQVIALADQEFRTTHAPWLPNYESQATYRRE